MLDKKNGDKKCFVTRVIQKFIFLNCCSMLTCCFLFIPLVLAGQVPYQDTGQSEYSIEKQYLQCFDKNLFSNLKLLQLWIIRVEAMYPSVTTYDIRMVPEQIIDYLINAHCELAQWKDAEHLLLSRLNGAPTSFPLPIDIASKRRRDYMQLFGVYTAQGAGSLALGSYKRALLLSFLYQGFPFTAIPVGIFYMVFAVKPKIQKQEQFRFFYVCFLPLIYWGAMAFLKCLNSYFLSGDVGRVAVNGHISEMNHLIESIELSALSILIGLMLAKKYRAVSQDVETPVIEPISRRLLRWIFLLILAWLLENKGQVSDGLNILYVNTLPVHFTWMQWVHLIAIAIIGPFSEEVCFRRGLFRYFSTLLGLEGSLFASSIVFASCHLDYMLFTEALWAGLIYGTLYWRTKNIGAPLLLHFLNNLGSFLNAYSKA